VVGREAMLRYVHFVKFREATSTEQAELTWGHIARSSSMNTDKGRRLLRYRPRYTSLQAVGEALHWLQQNTKADVGPPSSSCKQPLSEVVRPGGECARCPSRRPSGHLN
jgi:hypothetical protein